MTVEVTARVSRADLERLKMRVLELVAGESREGVERVETVMDLSGIPEGLVIESRERGSGEYFEQVVALSGQRGLVGGLALGFPNDVEPQDMGDRLQVAARQLTPLIEVWQLLQDRRDESDRHLERLQTIMEVGDVFAADMTIDRMLSLLLELAMGVVQAEVGAICLAEECDGGPKLSPRVTWGLEESVLDRLALQDGCRVSAQVMETGKPLVVSDLSSSELASSSGARVFLRNIVVFPLVFKGERVGVMYLANAPSSRLADEADVQTVEIVSTLTAAAIVNSRLVQEIVAKERMERELQLAAAIQSSVLPQQLPAIRGASVAAFSSPARSVGGDYYDIFAVDKDRTGLLVADVSGKGVAAAMLTMVVRAYLRVAVQQGLEPDAILAYVNRMVLGDVSDGRFITAVCAILDPNRGELVLSNAGHPPILLYRAASSAIEHLDLAGLPLGISDLDRYSSLRVRLSPGDVLVFYTDGVIEAHNPAGETYGLARLERLVGDCAAAAATDIGQRIMQELGDFAAATPQHDDVTLAVLRIDPKPEPLQT
jgi:serine phosphatase RsbU (regulator of sigma subunit)